LGDSLDPPKTDLLLAWHVATAKSHEANYATPLIELAHARGFTASTCALDKGYDLQPLYRDLEALDCVPVSPLRETPDVKRGDHRPPSFEHGEWRFAGADYQRKATKWRCPTGECQPASRWVKADRLHPRIPRETLRWRGLYRRRAAVEREFGRLKNEWALLPLRVRGLDRVRLHADLTILAKLSCALARTRAVPLAT
jgi:transposase